MNRRVPVVLLVLLGMAAGWYVGQTTTAPAWGQLAKKPAIEQTFDLHTVYLGNNYQALRIDRNSGAAWLEVADNKLAKIKDSEPLPPGDYDLSLITNGRVYLAHRIDRTTGRMWRISGEGWQELTPEK